MSSGRRRPRNGDFSMAVALLSSPTTMPLRTDEPDTTQASRFLGRHPAVRKRDASSCARARRVKLGAYPGTQPQTRVLERSRLRKSAHNDVEVAIRHARTEGLGGCID